MHRPLHILLPILVAFLYDTYVANDDLNVTVSEDHVIIERGRDRIIVPREAYEQGRKLPNPEKLREKIGSTIEAVERDESVASIGVARTVLDESPMIDIPRSDFPRVRELSEALISEPNSRTKSEVAVLSIVKAVFSDQRRKWDFVWNGVKISATIEDPVFIADLLRRVYTIGNGDAIECILDIHQNWDEASKIWLNVAYSVKSVTRYIPATQNPDLFGC